MPALFRLALAAFVLTSALTALHAGQALPTERDEILLKTGQKRQCWIIEETPDALGFIMAASTPKQTVSMRDVKSWAYSEMKAGYYAAGVEERDRGRLEDAADRFGQLAGTASTGRKWMFYYGRFNEGLCLGMAGKYAAAAQAFAELNKEGDYKNHRLWLDGRFQEGYNYAMAKDAEKAIKIADALIDFGRKKPLPTAEYRGSAIKAVLFAMQGDLGKAEAEFPKVKTNAQDEPDFWFQFNLFFADKQREGGRVKEAENKYRNLLIRDFVERDPAKKTQVALGLGLCLMQTDKPSALVELLKIDALPYGSPDQKCEARFHAGRILLEELAEGRKAETIDPRRRDYLKSLERSIRLLLVAASDSTATVPSREQAKGLLDGMGPDPEAPPPPPGTEGAPGDPATPATGNPGGTKAGTPKTGAPKTGAPKTGAPKTGAPKAGGAPSAGAPKTN